MKNKIVKLVYVLLIIISLWLSTTNIIQAIKCPKMTYTELFLNIPNSFMLNWSECN